MPTATTATGNLQSFTYDQLLFWADNYAGGKFNEYAATAAQYGVGEEEALLTLLDQSASPLHVYKAADGTYQGWFYQTVEQVTQTDPINSNASTVARGSLRQMVGQKFEDVGGVLTRNMTRYPVAGSLGQKAAYVLGSVGGAYMAASTGIWLGKKIDEALYDANPDYWDSIGLSTLNPDTWASITNGDDSPFAGLLNFILGIDPDTGQSQMYVDENTLAYLAYALAQNGVFATSTEFTPPSDIGTQFPNVTVDTVYAAGSATTNSYGRPVSNVLQSGDGPVYWGFLPRPAGSQASQSSATLAACSLKPFSYTNTNNPNLNFNAEQVTIGGNTFYASGYALFNGNLTNNYPAISNVYGVSSQQPIYRAWAYSVLFGQMSGGIEGISNQDGATLPDVSTWDTVPNTLTSLQQQYPDSWNNALVWDNYNDDGTPNQTRWIPIPSAVATYATDNQPTSGTQTQANTDVSTYPDTLVKLITEIVQQTKTQTQPETETPPDNPVDTGTGDTTPPIVPTGSASALWSVYHPTQAQVNSFGAWLWSDDFIDNIKKIMNDPMAGIITLHKIFATPVDSGSGTIVVGKLDSEVPSATVNQQYVTVDCGSVDLLEQFGNVFDYNPFTDVSLYLPFIGIVQLDTADVMRSTIHITYGVDVYTGACLAQVEVSRDGCTVNMYQYAGVCSVEYPLTGAQHNGLITGLLGIGTSVAGLVTGNLPMAAGAIGGAIASAAKRSQSRANSFSGNSGAMGIKTPYLIISRPQTKVASTFPALQGYPTNYSTRLGDCSGQVRVRAVHVEGINATDSELGEIENLLLSGILV